MTRDDRAVTLTELVVIFAACLVVTFHLAYLLQAPMWGWALSSCVVFALLRARATRFDAVALVLAGGLTTVLVLSTFAPPGVDGAMHSAIARLIFLADGHPTSFRPLWPLDRFDTYPVGQPSLVALFHVFAAPRAAALVGHAVTYGLTALALTSTMVRASGVARSAWSFALAWIAFFACRVPLQYWTWGGAPNALGLAFAALAFSFGITLWRRGDFRTMVACGILAAAALLTHGVSFIAALYLAIVLTTVQLLRERSLAPIKRLTVAGVIGLGCLVPYLVRFRWVLSEAEASWVARTSLATLTELHGLQMIPRSLHDMALVGTGVAAALLLWKARAKLVLPLIAVCVLLALILNGYSSRLPMSAALYPDRIVACFTLLIGVIWLLALPYAPKRAVPIFALLVGIPAAALTGRTIASGQEKTLLTPRDLAALEGLEAHMPKGCVVVANYGDAGQWLPALTSHPSTFPQVNVVFFDEVAEDATPCAAFIGERLVYGDNFVSETCQRDGCVQQGGFFRLTQPTIVRVVGAR